MIEVPQNKADMIKALTEAMSEAHLKSDVSDQGAHDGAQIFLMGKLASGADSFKRTIENLASSDPDPKDELEVVKKFIAEFVANKFGWSKSGPEQGQDGGISP